MVFVMVGKEWLVWLVVMVGGWLLVGGCYGSGGCELGNPDAGCG